ncbi:hypothetical protein GGI07_003010 [Coemansia sp. Benny D115]|nr:hypothetical protein GGI07_003010 [Coemansia sp. Benny D115]
MGSMPLSGYSSYASLLNKANLMFENNLDSMMVDWTLEEHECRRRLVQFWRRHENNNIFCTFKAVAAANRVPNSIVVSCIYWEEKHDFFITSVDCIHLLESLIAVRFTVEEKNRIRRNLEGFRPLTVSKCKAESAEFFKLIMSFPNPKPRNIEKDVKVFPWRILSLALKKIISKYTASYNSTTSLTLDAYPTASRVTSYSQLAGITPPASRDMAAFDPSSPASSVLGSSSVSAAIVAAAAASRNASNLAFSGMASRKPDTDSKVLADGSMPSSAYLPGTSLPTLTTPPANLAAMMDVQRPMNIPGFDGTSGVNCGSTLLASQGRQQVFGSFGTKQNANDALSGYVRQSMATAPSISVPAGGNAASDINQLLMMGDTDQRGGSRSAAASCVPPPPPPPTTQDGALEILSKTGGSQQSQALGSQSATGYQLAISGNSKFDFSGMVTGNPSPFIDTGVSGQSQLGSEMLQTPAMLIDQIAAGYGLSPSDYGIFQSQPQPPQRVVRSTSTKKPTSRAPYNTSKDERRRGGSSAGGANDSGSDKHGVLDTPPRIGSAQSIATDGRSERDVSPSIPLIFDQQCQDIRFKLSSGHAGLASSMLLGGPSADRAFGSVLKAAGEAQTGGDIFMPLFGVLDRVFGDVAKKSGCSNSSNSSSSGDTVFKSASPDTNREDSAASPTPVLVEPGMESEAFKFAIGDGLDVSEFNFLADLIGATSDQGGYTTSSHSSNSDINGDRKPLDVSDGLVDGDKCADVLMATTGQRDVDLVGADQGNGQVSASELLSRISTPTRSAAAVPVEAEPFYRSVVKPDQTPASGASAMHGLASPLGFGASLFSDGKPAYLMDGSHGF